MIYSYCTFIIQIKKNKATQNPQHALNMFQNDLQQTNQMPSINERRPEEITMECE